MTAYPDCFAFILADAIALFIRKEPRNMPTVTMAAIRTFIVISPWNTLK
jgi:hypothetical protein